MISVEFQKVGTGTCGWCRKEKDEVYTVAFSDKSFVGPMCKGDLLRAIGMKLPAEVASGTGTLVGTGSVTSVDGVPVASRSTVTATTTSTSKPPAAQPAGNSVAAK